MKALRALNMKGMKCLLALLWRTGNILFLPVHAQLSASRNVSERLSLSAMQSILLPCSSLSM